MSGYCDVINNWLWRHQQNVLHETTDCVLKEIPSWFAWQQNLTWRLQLVSKSSDFENRSFDIIQWRLKKYELQFDGGGVVVLHSGVEFDQLYASYLARRKMN